MTQEELKALKVRDILTMPEFKEEMARQISIEEESLKKASIEAVSNGCRLQRTPVDRLREREVYNADTMCRLFEAVLNKSLLGFSSAERQYIYGIGMLCFGRILAKLREGAEKKDE
jgi:hypothetical protein